MNILHAISDPGIIPIFHEKTGRQLKVLLSYEYARGTAHKITTTYRDRINLLYLDSGAFSVFTGKSKISVYEYRAYIRRYGHLYNEIFTLDDRFDNPEHNLHNQQFLEEDLPPTCKKPIPAIHDENDPFGEFEMYVTLGHDYIALGSMGAEKRIRPEVLDRIRKEYPQVRIHMFGNLDRNMLETYRPYSADSATWAHMAGKGGGILFWSERDKKLLPLNLGMRTSTEKRKDFVKKLPNWPEIEEHIKGTLGYSYDDLVTSYVARQVTNLYAFGEYEDYLNSLGV